jgi:MscS family membrane protein
MIALSGFLREVTRFRLGSVPAGRIGLALGAAVLSVLAGKLASWLFRRLGAGRKGLAGSLAGRLARPAGLLVTVFGVYWAVRNLPLSDSAVDLAGKGLLVAAVTCSAWIFLAAIDALSDQLAARGARPDRRFDDQMLPLVRNTAKVIAASVCGVFLLQSLGYPVDGILAGLGIGGLAVALAAQDTLAGIFASVAIILDRPFGVGDYIEVSGTQGTVEDIGLRSTRLRTPEKTLVSIPNRKLIELFVDNWSERPVRRTSLAVPLEPASDPDRTGALLSELRGLLDRDPSVEKGTFSVFVSGIRESALSVEMVFFLQTREYLEWLSLRSALYLEVLKSVRICGLKLACPMRLVVAAEAGPPGEVTGNASGRGSSGQA